MKLKFLFFVFFVSLSLACTGGYSEFEEMLDGFYRCEFEGVYVDEVTQKPVHNYFLERNMMPDKIENNLAHFSVNEKFHGLTVTDIYVPSSTLSAVVIIIDAPLGIVEENLHGYLVHGYNKEFQTGSEDPHVILVPKLEVYRLDSKKSALMCVL